LIKFYLKSLSKFAKLILSINHNLYKHLLRGMLKKMESINPSVEDIISICNSDKNRFKSYLNSNHNNMMSSLFSDETDEKSKIKTDFLLKNINKSSKEIILLLKEKKQENKYFNYYKNLILLLA